MNKYDSIWLNMIKMIKYDLKEMNICWVKAILYRCKPIYGIIWIRLQLVTSQFLAILSCRNACCQRWNHQLFVYNCIYIYIYIYSLLFLSIYCRIWSIFFFVVHALAVSIRNTKRRVVGNPKGICFSKYITWCKAILAFCCQNTSLF